MARSSQVFALALNILVFSSARLMAQDGAGWHISPANINIRVGEERPLQLLSDAAEELQGAEWSVDKPALGELSQEDGHPALHAKAAGTLHVTAVLNGQVQSREITIWPEDNPIPEGTTTWSLQQIGRELKQLAAVPTMDGPNMYSLEQTDNGSTYLRAISDDGIQLWTWRAPVQTNDVELVCGDWRGGAMITAANATSYRLYIVGKDGKVVWQQRIEGRRKGYAIGTDDTLYLLNQSVDGLTTTFSSIDEVSGAKRFELTLPSSQEEQARVRRQGTRFVCATEPLSRSRRTRTSSLFVNMDRYPYVSFTQTVRIVDSEKKCAAGASVDAGDVYVERNERLVLWQIHPDGSYRSTVVEEIKNKQPISAATYTISPAGGMIPDGENGVLIPTQWFDDTTSEASRAADDLVYRVNAGGEVVYKLPMPKYTGLLHEEMVLGENNIAFATRGGTLIAFDALTGRDLWHWDSNTPEISVFAALANGHCLVQTPDALVEVANSTDSKEMVKGKVSLDWQGRLFVEKN